ncbi:hypothetical protein F5X99DRAFT_406880 [Biscogniauxia marginata]|nr:hypothetical protein F5X99DRAFT_406880 [Biscogniauxia marginata]
MARGALKPPSVLGALLGDEFADKPKKKVTFVSPEISGSSSTSSSEEEDTDTTSDAESTHAEAGTDDELDELQEGIPELAIPTEEDNMATNDSSEAPGWTREEDHVIVKMKTEGSTWANIGKELDRGKKEVQRRYKALSSDAEKLGLTVEKLSQIWTEESEGKSEKKNKNVKNKDNSAKDEDDKGDGKEKGKGNNKSKAKSEKAKKGSGNGKDKSKKADTNKNDNKPADASSSSSKKAPTAKTDKKSKSKAKGKKQAVPAESSSSSSSSSDGDNNKQSSSSSSSEEEEDSEAEHWDQQRYLYHEMWAPLYPDQRALRPDANWSADDCRTLAVLEARQRALKWMYLQSDFYNATGRMVDAAILRAKFEEVTGE